MTQRLTREEFLAEFEWTRCRHGGVISVASTIFNSKPAAIARRLERLRAAGVQVNYIDDSRRYLTKETSNRTVGERKIKRGKQ